MRYFARLCYKGSEYCGWQRQPNQLSVQQVIEDTLTTLFNHPVEVTGCGRTDAGVHALDYVMHFDLNQKIPENLVRKLNRMLPGDIAFHEIKPVSDQAHARFDADERSYEYRIIKEKNPFKQQTSWYYPFFERTDFVLMQQAAALLFEYKAFYPFCKSRTDVKTMECRITRSEWVESESHKMWTYHITSDRFLRGMIRLIIGMCVSVGSGKMKIEDVHYALQHQVRLKMAVSVPPQGLFLNHIKYSYF